MSLIDLRGANKTYTTGHASVHALHPTDLRIDAGEFVAVMGSSGSGKSTLLNLLGLLDRPTRGEYWLDGRNVAELSDGARAETRCRKIGMVFQSFNLFPHFDVLQNVGVPMQYAGVRRGEIRRRALDLLETLGLADRATHKPSELSGGQCQRTAIARALANDPPLLLADEPTGNLDEKTGDEVIEIFRQLVADGRTVIMVTHNPQYERVVQRVIRLRDGRIAAP